MITNQDLADELLRQFGEEKISGFQENYGLLSVFTDVAYFRDILTYLRDHPTFQFNFLSDLTGIHFPDATGQELGLIYHLHSWSNNVRVLIKFFVPIEAPVVPTVTDLWLCADWMEREAYDFYGFQFEGHPNLLRILNIEEMDYFPMRKEYPLEDATRQDKIDALFGR
jgi:NADH-quinone oxidoreductase subunit C